MKSSANDSVSYESPKPSEAPRNIPSETFGLIERHNDRRRRAEDLKNRMMVSVNA